MTTKSWKISEAKARFSEQVSACEEEPQMAEMEHLGERRLDNYQNFAKTFKVKNFDMLLSADYLADKRSTLKPGKAFTPDQEARNARILAEAIRNQKL